MARPTSWAWCSLLVALLAGALVVGSEGRAAERAGTLGRPPQLVEAPQDFVTCTGWHALCSNSPDCEIDRDGITASCDCLRVNETHIVETFAIRDPVAKRLTQARCTTRHPCEVDQAPVCAAIKHGQYTVDHVKHPWVSTYSYRGWCSLLKVKPVPCDPGSPGYTGDRHWAICDAAPCTELQEPPHPERPLRCQCLVQDTPFVGPNGSCTGDHGGIVSSFPLEAWDFEKETYPFPMPGYEYVQGACAPLTSDPAVEPRGDGRPQGR